MAASVKGWVASNTGLPCFGLVGPGVLATSSGRVVVRVSDGARLYVADALGEVGVATRYLFAGGSVTLTRRVPGAVGSHQALLTGVDGRGVLVDFYENTGDQRSFKSGSSRFSNGVMRGAPGLDERSGESKLVLDSPARLLEVEAVLEQPGPVLIVLTGPALGVPGVRCVAVDDVKYKRTSVAGAVELVVSWTLTPYPTFGVDEWGGSALTWGDCALAGVTWGDSRTIDGLSLALTGGGL